MIEKTYGGYLNFDFNSLIDINSDYYCFNSGRSALSFLIKEKKPTRIKVPAYTCNAVIECIQKLNISYDYYFLDENLLPRNVLLGENELIIVNNYFGIIQNLISELNIDTSKLIVDNSQFNFFTNFTGTNLLSFYSPRKFFGLPDGGLIKRKFFNSTSYDDLPESFSYKRVRPLMESLEKGKEYLYPNYLESEKTIGKDKVARMSKITLKILESYDLALISNKRKFNFNFLHESLGKYNQLSNIINHSIQNGPLCYPFLFRDNKDIKNIKAELIKNKIFIPTYWPGIESRISIKNRVEFKLLNKLLCFPIDQNITKVDIFKMLKIILKTLNIR